MNLPRYELLFHGQLDDLTRALFAEYDLHDVRADIALHHLPMSGAALTELISRAGQLGLTVVAVQRVD